VLIFVLFLIAYTFATPGQCNGGSGGNAVLDSSDGGVDFNNDSFEHSKDYNDELPGDEKFMFEETFQRPGKKQHHADPFPKNKQEIKENKIKRSPLNTKPLLRFNKPAPGTPLGKTKFQPTSRQDEMAADKARLTGQKIITAGKIQFVELDDRMRQECLKEFFFCSISCTEDFGMSCKVDAKIFSAFVTRDQHAKICVAPRTRKIALDKKLGIKEKTKKRQECVLRPCGCKRYETQFVRLYGKTEYDRALKILQGKCHEWCTTGVKPKGIIDRGQAKKTINEMEKFLLEMYRKFYKFIGDFIEFGKKAIKAIGDAATKAGKFIAKGAQEAGKAIGKGAQDAGKAIGKGAQIVGKGFGDAAKNVGNGFRSAGRRIGRFFRRFRW